MYGITFDDGAKPEDGQPFTIRIRGLPDGAAKPGLRFRFPDGAERTASAVTKLPEPVVKGSAWDGEFLPPDVVRVLATPTPG
jgi:hypothetical protein